MASSFTVIPIHIYMLGILIRDSYVMISILQIGAGEATYYFGNGSKPVSPKQFGNNNELFANN